MLNGAFLMTKCITFIYKTMCLALLPLLVNLFVIVFSF